MGYSGPAQWCLLRLYSEFKLADLLVCDRGVQVADEQSAVQCSLVLGKGDSSSVCLRPLQLRDCRSVKL